MTSRELIDQIREAGGKLRVRDGQLYGKRIPEGLTAELKQREEEIVSHLRLEAARNPFSPSYRFPRCPACESYALYRRNNVGNYQCQTCALEGISEVAARRIE